MRLQIAVQDAPLVAVGQSTKQLHEEEPHVAQADHSLELLHVLAQVVLHELEDKRKHALRVDNVVQRDDIRVLQVSQERHFANGRARSAFLVLESDFLKLRVLTLTTLAMYTLSATLFPVSRLLPR